MIKLYIWSKVLQGEYEYYLKILAPYLKDAREIAKVHLRERYGEVRKGDLEKKPRVISKRGDLTN